MIMLTPDIPIPKPEDKDYMKVWHKYLQSDIDNYKIREERDTWRKAFYVVAVILFATVFALLVMCSSHLLFYFREL